MWWIILIGVGDFKVTKKQREYIGHVLDSNWLSYGQMSKLFEQELSSLHGCEYGVLSNSGTSSLLVALKTLKEVHNWQDGDKIIVPAITFVATVNVVLQAGLTPVLVDVEKRYYGIDCTQLEDLNLSDNWIKAIVPVHTFGMPCDMRHLMQIADYYNLKVIEDSCECMFATHYDKSVGSFGDIACFSTYMAHLITTGVGGMSITNNPEYAKITRSFVNHGMAYDDLSEDGTFNPIRTKRDFVFERMGYSFRAAELEAALGLAQLEDYQDMIKQRQVNASWLSGLLCDYEDRLQLLSVRQDTTHSAMMYPLICLQDNIRDNLCQHLADNGIGTRRMLPLTNQPVYKDLFNEDDYPVAKWINENGFYVGCHQYLKDEEIEYVATKIKEFFN